MRDLSFRLEADISMLDTGYWILDARYWMPNKTVYGVRYGKVSGVRKNVQGARYKAQGSRRRSYLKN